MARKKNSLRIIGGVWRSRRIQFIDCAQVRPTAERIRETLFNWLSAKIVGAHCLDLFAGSGALGFEAASRGAGHVTQVDCDAAVVAKLDEQKQALMARQVRIVHQEALAFLRQTEQKFDVVFLDPPFGTNLLEPVLPTLDAHEIVAPSGLLYVESPVFPYASRHLDAFACIRENTAGRVHYALYQKS